MARDGRQRISIDIPAEVYKRVKDSCEKRMCTFTKYLVRALVEALKKEDSYK